MLLSHMANESTDNLTPLFAALADPTRRAIVEALAEGPLPVTALAEDHNMALPSFLKHLGKLEKTGVIKSQKTGRVRTCHLQPAAFGPLQDWVERERARWGGKLDRLAAQLEALDKETKQ